MSEELEVLKTVARRLERLGLPSMLTGSMALNYYAVPRMTRDIDLVVELSEADAERFCEAFQEDFSLDRDAVRQAVAEAGSFNRRRIRVEHDVRCTDASLVAVEPRPSSLESGWMAEFTEDVSDAGLRRSLLAALEGRRPFRRFKDVLAGHPSERERWFAVHARRVQDAIREWLTEQDIEPTVPLRQRE